MANFENTLTTSIFVVISTMITFWKSHGYFASNEIDLVDICALCQKITNLEGKPLLIYVMKPYK